MSLAASSRASTDHGCVDMYSLLIELHQKVKSCEHLPSEQRDELYLELNNMIQKRNVNEKRLKEIQELLATPILVRRLSEVRMNARVFAYNESEKQTDASRAIQKMLNL
jgi:uncharacterized protein (UPF0276 family)